MSKDYGNIRMGGNQDDPSIGANQGENPIPTKGPLAARSASPAAYATSGIERAMGDHADKVHPVSKRHPVGGKNGTF